MAFYKTETKVDLGIIKSVNKINKEIVSYVIKLENYHQENDRAIGIPVFSFGYNSYTYIEGSRVLCLIKDSDNKKVFIVGQTYDPAITRGGFVPDQGETILSSGGDDKSGIAPLGKNNIFHAYTDNSFLKFDSQKINISIGDKFIINGSNSFYSLITDKENNGFVIKNGTFNFKANNGYNFFSKDGAIYLEAQRIAFYEGRKKNADFLISNGIHRQTGNESLQIFGIYSFEAGSSKIKGKKFAVDWNVIQGSYGINLGTGDFKINLTNSLAAEVSFKIGQAPVYLSQFVFNESKLEVTMGTPINGDVLTLGGGSFDVSAGSTPLTHSTLKVADSKIEFVAKGGIANSEMKLDSSGIKLIPPSKLLGGKIVLDGEVEITGKLTVKGSDGVEVSTGDVTVTLGDVIGGLTKISLTKHKHASSIPGGPSSPLPG